MREGEKMTVNQVSGPQAITCLHPNTPQFITSGHRYIKYSFQKL